MGKKMRLLIVEDVATDAELIIRELGKADFAHTTKWVKSREEFLGAFGEYSPDIILCDYQMPGFGASEALKIFKERSLEIPFIVVSGTIGEDIAVEMMKSGAADYVMKDRLNRLAPAVKRALNEAQDHAERKRAEKALRASEQEFRTLTEAMPQIVWVTRADGWNIYFNQQWVDYTGLTLEESYGHSWNTPFHPDDKQRVWDALQQATQNNDVYSLECRLRRADGVYRWWLVRGVPFRDAAGKIVKWFGTCTDIDGIKRAAEALVELAHTKAKFTAMVSHELRSPIAVIKEALNIVLDGLTGPLNNEQKDVLETSKEHVDRLGRLINNVLDCQKIEAGKMGYDLRENDLNDVAREVHKSMTILSKRKNLDLRLELGEGLTKMKFDREKIVQVLLNLVSNAIKNTTTGSVTVSTQRESGEVHVRVRDTGKGIPAEDLPKLFIPFERIDRLREQEKGGTGLGLSIAKELVLAHHGKIWAESEMGMGTTFHVTLPL